MIDVVGELFLYTLLLPLLVQCRTMFAVAVGIGLLQTGIETHYMIGYGTKLVTRKRLSIVNAFTTFGPFGKTVEPKDMLSQPSGYKEP